MALQWGYASWQQAKGRHGWARLLWHFCFVTHLKTEDCWYLKCQRQEPAVVVKLSDNFICAIWYSLFICNSTSRSF